MKLNNLEKGKLVWIEFKNGLCEIGNYQEIIFCGENSYIKLFPYVGVRGVLVNKHEVIRGIRKRRQINCKCLEDFIMNSFYPNLKFVKKIKSDEKDIGKELAKKGFSIEDYNNFLVKN